MIFTSRIVKESPEMPPESSQEAAPLPRSPCRLKLKQASNMGARLKKNRTTSLASISYEEAQQKITMRPPEGVTKVSPITIYQNNRGGKAIRARRVGDELANQALSRGQRPTRRAIKMANALRVERLLETGRYKSVRELAMRTGISRNTLGELLEMLNQGVKEIEKVLFEVG